MAGTVLAGLILCGTGIALFPRSRHVAAPVSPPVPAISLPAAEQALRNSLARFPRDPDTHRALARYLLDQHRPFEALWHFLAVQDLAPAGSDPSVDVARALAQAGFPERAAALLRGERSSSLDAHLALAEIAMRTARPQAALATLSGSGPALFTSAPAQLLGGDARAVLGDAAGARSAYRRAVALAPEEAAGHDRLGRLALARAAWSEARQEIAAARERDPGEPAYGYRLGQAYEGAGQKAEAEQLWREIAGSSPGYSPVQIALGKLYQSRGDLSNAASYLVAAVNADPASKEAQFALAAVMTSLGKPASAAYQQGIYYLQTERPERAAAAFARITALDPARADGPRWVSLAYTQMKRLDRAAAAAQRGLDQHPDDPALLGQLAALHILGRNRPQAARLCQAWIQRNPRAAEPYRLLARIAREENRLPDALRYGQRALDLDPQDAKAPVDLAKTLSAIGGPQNNRRALDLAERGTALAPREADDWLELGILQSESDPAAAADALLRALDLDPSATAACSALVPVALREQRPASARLFAALATDIQSRQRASARLWQAVYRQPADAAARERLVRMLLAAGELRRAGYQIEELATLQPSDAAIRRERLLVQHLLDLQGD